MGRTLEQLIADEKPEVVAQSTGAGGGHHAEHSLPSCVKKYRKRRLKWRRRWGSGSRPLP